MRWSPRPIAISLGLFVTLLFCARANGQSTEASETSQTPPTAVSPAATAPVKKPVSKKKVVRKRRLKKTSNPGKIVVRQGGTSETLPQMAPSGSKPRESSQRRQSGDLLTATDANLKSLGDKKLTPDQEATLSQIKQFMEQSRAALDAGDVKQGYNLANKANVLSEELKKP